MINEIHDLKIDVEYKDGERGKHCFITDCPVFVEEIYGLQNKKVILKVFDTIENNIPYEEMKWGDDPKMIHDRKRNGMLTTDTRRNTFLKDATIIQNICHWEGLAPRVYGLVSVIYKGKEYVAQITDFVGGEFGGLDENRKPLRAEALYQKIIKLGNKYGWEVAKQDVAERDEKDGQFIDFQTFMLNAKYKKWLLENYKEGTKWGKVYYQENESLGLSGGPRDFKQRVKEIGLDKIDFRGKTVLDIGCSGGNFLKYALEGGAKKVVGLDFPDVINGTRAVFNDEGYYHADFYGVDLRETNTEKLRKLIGMDKFDIVFYMSMFRHVHFPSFIWELCGGLAIIEWNNWKTEKEIEAMVKEKFTIIQKGKTTDHGTGKDYYICKPL